MAISDSNLSTSVWTDVRTVLVAASLTASNSSTSTNYSANIGASYNDKSGAKPQVIINPVMMDEDSAKFGGSYGKRMINVMIDIYASNTEYMDQISDQVKEALKDEAITGIDLISVSEDYAFSSPGGNKYHLKTLVFSYQREA